MISREEYIQIRGQDITKNYNPQDLAKLFLDFCKEKGAREDQTDYINSCISQIFSSGTWEQYYNIIKDEYNIKFGVTEVYDKETEIQTPFGIRKTRKLISVY